MLLRVNRHILSKLGSLTVKSVKPIQSQNIMNNLEGYSWSTVQKVYQDLQFIFRTALQNHLIPPYPLRDSFVPYELRQYTYCSDLARQGIDIRVAQKLMGHSSISITADIYTHVQDEQILDNAAQILGQISLKDITG